MTLDQGCCPVGLFDRIEDMEPRSFQYEGEGHLVMYTDGLLELVEGGHDEKLDYLKEHLGGPHHWREDEMKEQYFVDDPSQEREDDKCLVWISLKNRHEFPSHPRHERV